MINELKLQHQLSNGAWVDNNNPPNKVEAAARRNWLTVDGVITYSHSDDAVRPMTIDEVVEALASGLTLSTGTDWYSNIRSGAWVDAMAELRDAARREPEMVRCACGHTVPRSQVMSASRGTACPDCYDRMSDYND